MNVRELIDALDEFGDHLTVAIVVDDSRTEDVAVGESTDSNGQTCVELVGES